MNYAGLLVSVISYRCTWCAITLSGSRLISDKFVYLKPYVVGRVNINIMIFIKHFVGSKTINYTLMVVCLKTSILSCWRVFKNSVWHSLYVRTRLGKKRKKKIENNKFTSHIWVPVPIVSIIHSNHNIAQGHIHIQIDRRVANLLQNIFVNTSCCT